MMDSGSDRLEAAHGDKKEAWLKVRDTDTGW